MPKHTKVDRRTQQTVQRIKDCFLALVNQAGYNKVTVAQICRDADINRSTFYLHFTSLTDVLNAVLDDALQFIHPASIPLDPQTHYSFDYLQQNESLIPTCQRVGDQVQYRQLLLDPDLSEYIVGRIMYHERPHGIPAIMESTGLNQQDATTLFRYIIHGSFAVNRAHRFQKDEQWSHDVQLLNTFIQAGYQKLKQP